MSMGKRERERQSELWLATSHLAQSPGHPFYERLNAVLAEAGFDTRTEELCGPYYARGKGRPIAYGLPREGHLASSRRLSGHATFAAWDV